MIKMENISKQYNHTNSKIIALNEIDLIINNGDRIGLIGDSGSGKTTLIKILLGIIQPSTGNIYINSKSLSNNQYTDWRFQNVGYLAQNHTSYQYLNLKRQIELSISLNSKLNRSCLSMEKIQKYLKILNLDMLLHHFPQQISIGQKQRFELLLLLIKLPSIIILDEPTSAQDYNNSINIIKILKSFIKQYNSTIILCTHDYNILQICEKVIQLNAI